MREKLVLGLLLVSLGLGTAIADPFSSLSPNAPALKNYSPHQLIMVGTISQGDSILGIVKTPSNEVYTVKPGSEIGNSAYVVGVTSQQITVSQHSQMIELALQKIK